MPRPRLHRSGLVIGLGLTLSAMGLGLHSAAQPRLGVDADVAERPARTYAPVGATPADPLAGVLNQADPAGQLAEIAADRRNDLVLRGRAIATLVERGGGAEADEALERIRDDRQNVELVRTWAAAARLKRVDSLDELAALAPHAQRHPQLRRPFSRAAAALLGDRDLERPEAPDHGSYPAMVSTVSVSA